MTEAEALREIPQMDTLLREEVFAELAQEYGRVAVRDALRLLLDRWRAQIRAGERQPPTQAVLAEQVGERLRAGEGRMLRRVLNATGVALHTNLGRAPLSAFAREAVWEAAGYTDLEYDLATGTRGNRRAFYEPQLCALCGCEAALVVNNNAAALLLALHTLAPGKEAILSRGELVEIGDGFRIPEIMATSGAVLREVGATNRTHLADYAEAIGAQTGLLLKVLTSNYRISGFTGSVSIEPLAALGRERGIPLLVDLGSGALWERDAFADLEETTVSQALEAGAQLVCFSGDKLLGGPQAGILCGSRTLIDRLARHPMARALRIDKLSLAALTATLALYRDPARAYRELPVLASLSATPQALAQKAQELAALLCAARLDAGIEVCAQPRPVGGGAAPCKLLDGYAVCICPHQSSSETIEERLRQAALPVVALLRDGALRFDVATLARSDFPYLVELLTALCGVSE